MMKYWLTTLDFFFKCLFPTLECASAPISTLAPAAGFGGPPALQCGPLAHAYQYLKFNFPWSYYGGLFFLIFLDRMSVV